VWRRQAKYTHVFSYLYTISLTTSLHLLMLSARLLRTHCQPLPTGNMILHMGRDDTSRVDWLYSVI
jgi:hypothetical protein